MATKNRHDLHTSHDSDPLAVFAMTNSAAPDAGGDFNVTDLVGWAIRSTPRGDGPNTPERMRDLLAAAMGVAPDALGSLADKDVEVAVSRLRNLVDQCRNLAAEVTVDELTGALRRGAGIVALQREIDRARRSRERDTVVVFIDADGLKKVNDTRGHAAGDQFLRDVVTCLRERLRSYDLIVRYGGDEFFCVLSNADLGVASRLITDIRESIRVRTDGLSVSAGVTTVRPDDTAESVLARADRELYAARRTTNAR